MTKEGAIFQWFNSAIPGVTAYVETNVPSKVRGDSEDATFPRLIYPPVDAGFGEEVSLPVKLWFKTFSEVEINTAVRTLYELVGDGGALIGFNGGAVWVKRGIPFSQPAYDDSDSTVRGRYINLIQEKISR